MKLIEKADVVCDSFAAGELEKYNIGYEAARKVNPEIIYASHTGFGKTGSLSSSAGCDLTSEALCGLMQVTGFPDRRSYCTWIQNSRSIRRSFFCGIYCHGSHGKK